MIKSKNLKTGKWDAFRDFTQTIRLEQWHSKSINGIRQAFYLSLWLYNFTKLKLLSKFGSAKESMKDTYEKPNFKILWGWIAKNFVRTCKEVQGVWKIFVELIAATIETRTRHSRSYPREIKSPQSPFPYNNTKWNLS